MAASPDLTRLAGLLRDPRQTLDVEIKGWIDIVQNEEHRALLAKALIALTGIFGCDWCDLDRTESELSLVSCSLRTLEGAPSRLNALSPKAS